MAHYNLTSPGIWTLNDPSAPGYIGGSFPNATFGGPFITGDSFIFSGNGHGDYVASLTTPPFAYGDITQVVVVVSLQNTGGSLSGANFSLFLPILGGVSAGSSAIAMDGTNYSFTFNYPADFSSSPNAYSNMVISPNWLVNGAFVQAFEIVSVDAFTNSIVPHFFKNLVGVQEIP